MSTAAIVWLCINVFLLGVAAMVHGRMPTKPLSFPWALGMFTFNVVLLNWGGFFS